jgi:hypothetical protein
MRKAWKARQRQKETTVRTNQDSVEVMECNEFQAVRQTPGFFNHFSGMSVREDNFVFR